MPQKTRTIHIKWVRSGIGFSRKQKEVVRSIGLHRLNQVVERPDTPHFRGLVAKVSHLVEVVEPPSKPAWHSCPEYTIIPAETQIRKSPAGENAVPAAPAESEAAEKSVPAPQTAGAPKEIEDAAPERKPAEVKVSTAGSAVKKASGKSEKPKTRGEAKAAKAPAKKASKPTKGKK